MGVLWLEQCRSRSSKFVVLVGNRRRRSDSVQGAQIDERDVEEVGALCIRLTRTCACLIQLERPNLAVEVYVGGIDGQVTIGWIQSEGGLLLAIQSDLGNELHDADPVLCRTLSVSLVVLWLDHHWPSSAD